MKGDALGERGKSSGAIAGAYIGLPLAFGFLGLGSDTNGVINNRGGFTVDGFTTPATAFPTNFGMRVR